MGGKRTLALRPEADVPHPTQPNRNSWFLWSSKADVRMLGVIERPARLSPNAPRAGRLPGSVIVSLNLLPPNADATFASPFFKLGVLGAEHVVRFGLGFVFTAVAASTVFAAPMSAEEKAVLQQ